MPLYEYQCAACGARFERIQKFSDLPEAACPKCGGAAERRLSPPAIRFKGSGWYVTDYARKSTPAEKTDTAGESKAEGEKDKKPAESKTPPESSTKTE